MDGWADGRMDEWTDGWMGRWTDGWMGGWMNGRMDGWVDGRMDGRMDEWTDGWADGRMDGWADGWMDEWTDGGMECDHLFWTTQRMAFRSGDSHPEDLPLLLKHRRSSSYTQHNTQSTCENPVSPTNTFYIQWLENENLVVCLLSKKKRRKQSCYADEKHKSI